MDPSTDRTSQSADDAARRAVIASSERILGRPLTDEERACIHVDMTGGENFVAAPLSDRLKEKTNAMKLGSSKPTTQPDAG